MFHMGASYILYVLRKKKKGPKLDTCLSPGWYSHLLDFYYIFSHGKLDRYGGLNKMDKGFVGGQYVLYTIVTVQYMQLSKYKMVTKGTKGSGYHPSEIYIYI